MIQSPDEEEEVENGDSHTPELDRRSTFLLGTIPDVLGDK